jgi:hypothetical protein
MNNHILKATPIIYANEHHYFNKVGPNFKEYSQLLDVRYPETFNYLILK